MDRDVYEPDGDTCHRQIRERPSDIPNDRSVTTTQKRDDFTHGYSVSTWNRPTANSTKQAARISACAGGRFVQGESISKGLAGILPGR